MFCLRTLTNFTIYTLYSLVLKHSLYGHLASLINYPFYLLSTILKLKGSLGVGAAETFQATFLGRLWLERRRVQWTTPSRGRAIQRCRNRGVSCVSSRDNVTINFDLGVSLKFEDNQKDRL